MSSLLSYSRRQVLTHEWQKRARKSTATQADTISLDGSDDEANARPQNGAANDDDEDEQVDEDENMDMEADEEEEELVRKAAQKLTQKDKAAKAAGKSTGVRPAVSSLSLLV